MPPPRLTLYQQGQGSVSSDGLNTFIQTAVNVAQVRGFSGLQNMVLFIEGYVLSGDGGAGTFYWNETSVQVDNGGISVIAPTGTAVGRWIRLTAIGLVSTVDNMFISASNYATLTLADAAAVAAGMPLFINEAYTLTANQTLNSPLIIQGGSITLGYYNLTINSTVNASLNRWLICASTGMVTFAKNIVSELRWFALGDSVTVETIPCQAWCNSSACRHASAGNYLTDTITVHSSVGSIQSIIDGYIYGDTGGTPVFYWGPGVNNNLTHYPNAVGITTFISMSGNDVFLLETAKRSLHFSIGRFNVIGQGSGVGNGYAVHVPSGMTSVIEFTAEYINASFIGGGCIWDEGNQTFTSKYIELFGTHVGNHCFDIFGGNTNYMEHCYASIMDTAGKAGYRIHGSLILKDCNGIDGGNFWGIFGSATVDTTLPAGINGGPFTIPSDGVTAYSSVRLEGCNLESYGSVGVVCLNGSVSIDGKTSMIATSTGTVIAIYLAGSCPSTYSGFIEKYENVIVSYGATFYHSCPIHTPSSNTRQFFYSIHSMGDITTTYAPIWDYGSGAQRNFSCLGMMYPGFARDGISTTAITARMLHPEYFAMTQFTPAKNGVGLIGELALDANNLWLCSASGKWLAIGDPVKHQYSTNSSTSASLALVAADIFGGAHEHALNLTGAITVASNATLPTVSALVTGIVNALSGQTYMLRIINGGGTGSGVWTILTNTGWTLNGTTMNIPVLAAGVRNYRDFYVTLTSLTTATLQAIDGL